MDSVRIQIVNYRTRKRLLKCLTSLVDDLQNFSGVYSVAILDNASGEDLSDLPTRFSGLQHLETYQGERNIGFAAGHNFLAKHGGADWLLLLNPDIKLIELNTVQRLIARAVSFGADVIGPRLVTQSGTTQPWDHGELHGLRAWIALHSGNSFWREQSKPTEAAWVSGAAFLIRNDRFWELDGFDEHFFLYKEEEELCWRLCAAGGKVLYDPAITVFHHGGVVAKKSEHMQQSVSYFLQKHFRSRWNYPFLKQLNRILH